jgi:hypothetical protein
MSTSTMIGGSEIRGAAATSIPSFLPFFKVSETTKVMRGPGDKPAAKPKIIPKRKESASEVQFPPARLILSVVYGL